MVQIKKGTHDAGPTDEIVRCVLEKVATYMKIVENTTVHMVPQAINLYIIKKLEKYIKTDLLVQIVDQIVENNVSSFHWLLILFAFI